MKTDDDMAITIDEILGLIFSLFIPIIQKITINKNNVNDPNFNKFLRLNLSIIKTDNIENRKFTSPNIIETIYGFLNPNEINIFDP